MNSASATKQIRNTVVYLGTIGMTQVSSFVLLPIITRFLGPSVYGEYALALAVSGLVGMVATSWIRNVALRYYYDEREARVTRSFYWSLAAMQGLVVMVTFSTATVILPHLGLEAITVPTMLAAATMVFVSDFQALTLSFVRAEERSGRYAAAEIITAVTRLGGTSIGLVLGFREPAFLFLASAGAALVGGVIAYLGLADTLTGRGQLSWSAMRKVARHIFGALPFSLGEWLGRLSDRLVLNVYATTSVVGIYSAGFSLGDSIIGGLVMAVFMMAWPDILNSWANGGFAAARAAIKQYFQIYLWLTVGPLVALLVFGGTVVTLLGPAYSEAVAVLGLVATAAWLRGLANGFNRHFELEKRFYALSLVTIFGAVANLSLNLWLVPRLLATGAGVAALVSQLLVATIYVVIRDRRLVRFPGADAVIVIICSALAAAAIRAVLGQTIIGLVCFAGSYTALLGAVWGRRIRKLRA